MAQPRTTFEADGTIVGETNKRIVRRYIMEGWAQGDVSVVDELVRPDVVDHDPFPGQAAGSPGWVQAIEMVRHAMPDLTVRIEEMVAEGDRVAVRWVCPGTNTGPFAGRAPTGQRLTIVGIDMHRLANGRIAETHRVLRFQE